MEVSTIMGAIHQWGVSTDGKYPPMGVSTNGRCPLNGNYPLVGGIQ